MQYQHLTIAVSSRTNAYGWDRDCLRDLFGHFLCYHLKDNPENSCIFQRLCIFDQPLARVSVLALDSIASVKGCRLRGYANMTEDRYTCIRDCFGHVCHLSSSFDLDSFHSSFFDEASCVSYRIFFRDLEAQERHVANQ